MTSAAHVHAPAAGPATAAWLAGVTLVAAAYLLLAHRRRREPRGWSSWRIVAFLAGSALLALGFTPALLPFAHGDFRQHMVQHLLIGMLAPLGLVLGAPVTLVLRSAGTRGRRVVGRVLASAPVRLLATPAVALLLNVGGMAALYFTSLFAVMHAQPALHHAVHAHFLAAGVLFTWVIAGPDPAPHRPSVPARLVVLGVAIAIHASLAQLLYAGAFVSLPIPDEHRRAGAVLMYYGGDVAELLLAFALVSTWRPRPGARLATR